MNVEKVTFWILVIGIVLCLALVAAAFLRKRFRVLVSILLVLMCAVNGTVYGLNNVINQYFSAVVVDPLGIEEATAGSRDISRRLAEEGIVLLQNQGGALPLPVGAKVNLFGQSSISPVYGGSGSGASDESSNVTLIQGLESAGFQVNPELTAFYTDRQAGKKSTNIFNLKGGDYNLNEPAAADYSDALWQAAREYSDIALVVFSRNGGEGGDLPLTMEKYDGGSADKHYLELQTAEIELLDRVRADFGTVVVLINSSNAMELGFLEQEGVDGALWIGGPGSTGCLAVGEVLSGAVNPSGRLADTYAYDLTTAPAYWNCGDFRYTVNGEKYAGRYVEYAEGIYVGYRFYETRFVDNTTGLCDEEAYKAAVQFPFGYGLSYTAFEQKLLSHKERDGEVTVKVEVKNTGSAPGKETVQLYFTAPYTVGGMEKAHVELIAFGKTGLLQPGSAETVELTFNVEDMAGYDYVNNGCYLLEQGDYAVKLMKNAHEVMDSFTITVDKDVVYGEQNPRSTDDTAAVNRFGYAAGGVTYVSRSDWEGTLPKERVDSKEASEEIQYALNIENIHALYCAELSGDMPKTDVNAGLKLEAMVGVEYDDPQWETFIDQLNVKDMAKLMGYGGFSTQAIDSVGKTSTIDIDGPAGLNALTSSISGVQFPSEALIGSTFNTELVEEMGRAYAQEAGANGVTGLYAPGVNIHRTPFSGRNFEYYSEDPLLTGKLGAALTRGFAELGVYCYPKHFALNDQETNRSGVCVWSNEQAIRELYLHAFEVLIREGVAHGLMSSYNRIGTVWTGGNKQLLTEVLRGEWGFTGAVATDYANSKFMNPDQALLAGGDLMLSTTGSVPTDEIIASPAGVTALKRAAKNVMFMVVNSKAYSDPVVMSFPWWLFYSIGANAVVFGLCLVLVLTKKKQNCKNENKTVNSVEA